MSNDITIRVAILDDHQSIIDGYVFRPSQVPGIEVVATANYANGFEDLLGQYEIDVLILDIFAIIKELGNAVRSIAGGAIYFSQQAHQHLVKRTPESPQRRPHRRRVEDRFCSWKWHTGDRELEA